MLEIPHRPMSQIHQPVTGLSTMGDAQTGLRLTRQDGVADIGRGFPEPASTTLCPELEEAVAPNRSPGAQRRLSVVVVHNEYQQAGGEDAVVQCGSRTCSDGMATNCTSITSPTRGSTAIGRVALFGRRCGTIGPTDQLVSYSAQSSAADRAFPQHPAVDLARRVLRRPATGHSRRSDASQLSVALSERGLPARRAGLRAVSWQGRSVARRRTRLLSR